MIQAINDTEFNAYYWRSLLTDCSLLTYSIKQYSFCLSLYCIMTPECSGEMKSPSQQMYS